MLVEETVMLAGILGVPAVEQSPKRVVGTQLTIGCEADLLRE